MLTFSDYLPDLFPLERILAYDNPEARRRADEILSSRPPFFPRIGDLYRTKSMPQLPDEPHTAFTLFYAPSTIEEIHQFDYEKTWNKKELEQVEPRRKDKSFWETYVASLLEFARMDFPTVVYLAPNLAPIRGILEEAGCRVAMMQRPPVGIGQGGCFRYLGFDHCRRVYVADSDSPARHNAAKRALALEKTLPGRFYRPLQTTTERGRYTPILGQLMYKNGTEMPNTKRLLEAFTVFSLLHENAPSYVASGQLDKEPYRYNPQAWPPPGHRDAGITFPFYCFDETFLFMGLYHYLTTKGKMTTHVLRHIEQFDPNQGRDLEYQRGHGNQIIEP